MSQFVSLDGVIEDPDGGEGSRVGGWFGKIKNREEVNKVKLDEALGTEALLLGRRSYQFFAARWASRGGDLADRLNRLPKYVVYASFQLLRTLLEHDLVDELRLMIHPVVLGAGERLFGETSDKKPMRLVDTRIVDDDIAYLTYEPVRDAQLPLRRRRPARAGSRRQAKPE